MKQIETDDWKQGLSKRHVAQIIRRNMITRSKPSGKVYDRKKLQLKVAS